jgi:hypothetical protein
MSDYKKLIVRDEVDFDDDNDVIFERCNNTVEISQNGQTIVIYTSEIEKIIDALKSIN